MHEKKNVIFDMSFCVNFIHIYDHTLLFHQANLLNWTQNLLTRNWRCHMTTWQWSGMRPRPKKATARSVSAARAATAWLEMSTLTVVDTTGRLWLEGAHGERDFGLVIIHIWKKPSSCDCLQWKSLKPYDADCRAIKIYLFFLYSSGTLWA